MKVLHILRSEPDDMVRKLMQGAGAGKDQSEFPLFLKPVDYDRLVQEIFSSDRVISWW